jgi:hypothetical protein
MTGPDGSSLHAPAMQAIASSAAILDKHVMIDLSGLFM